MPDQQCYQHLPQPNEECPFKVFTLQWQVLVAANDHQQHNPTDPEWLQAVTQYAQKGLCYRPAQARHIAQR